MVHSMVGLRPYVYRKRSIPGPKVTSNPNPVADATRPCFEGLTDTNSCLGEFLGGERQPHERLGAHTLSSAASAHWHQIRTLQRPERGGLTQVCSVTRILG